MGAVLQYKTLDNIFLGKTLIKMGICFDGLADLFKYQIVLQSARIHFKHTKRPFLSEMPVCRVE